MDGDFKRPLGNNNNGVTPAARSGGYEDSPETYENAQGAPVEVANEPQVVQEKKPGKAKKLLKWFLLTLLILGLAGAAGWFWYDGQGAKKEVSDLRVQLESAQSATKTAQAKAVELEKSSKTTAAKSDEELIKLAVQRYFSVLKTPLDMVIDSTAKPTIDGAYASIAVNNKSGGGTTAYLKRSAVTADWQMLFADNGGGIPKYVNDTFGTPSMVKNPQIIP